MKAADNPNYIKFNCEHCGQDLEIHADNYGAWIDCPTCQKKTFAKTSGGLPPKVPASKPKLYKHGRTGVYVCGGIGLACLGIGGLAFLGSSSVMHETFVAIVVGVGVLCIVGAFIIDAVLDVADEVRFK